MADKDRINNKSFIGFQSALGTAASADKQLPDVAIVPDQEGVIRAIETSGEEFPTGAQHGLISTPLAVNGTMGFVSICYLLEALFGTVTPTTVATTGKKRVYTPATTRPRYFTNDYGDSVRFQRAIDCFLNKLHLHATLNETLVDGAGMGQATLDSVLDSLTLAGSPTTVAQKTPDPLKSDLFIATSLAGLDSASALGRGFVFDFNLDGRWAAIHPMKSSLAGSYDGVARKKPGTADGMIQLGADDDGWAWLTRAKANTIAYLRWLITGDLIGGTTTYTIQVDQAVAANKFPKRGSAQNYAEGLDVLDIGLWLMKTSTLNGCQITVINETVTL